MGEADIRSLAKLPLLIVIMAILITIVGGTVRIFDAGESCPDWPTCFGTFGFDITSEEQEIWWEENPHEIDSRGEQQRYNTFEIFVEWFHRFLVGIIALPIFFNVFYTNKNRLELGEKVRNLAIFSAILLLIQAVAGYITVKFDNADWTVALHLSLASIFISVLVWQWLSWKQVIDPSNKLFSLSSNNAQLMKTPVIVMMIAVLSLLVLGAWVASTAGGNYNQACGVGSEAWPLCKGEVVPELSETPILVQMIHRVAVLIAGIILFWGYRTSITNLGKQSPLTKTVTMSFHLWATNVLVGAAYLLTASDGFIEWLSLLHLILAVTTFVLMAVSLILIDLSGDEYMEEE